MRNVTMTQSYQHQMQYNDLDQKTFERAVKPSLAKALLQAVCADFNVSLSTEVFGAAIPIYKCRLTSGGQFSAQAQQVFIAGGKGFGQQGEVSAMYEAAQHFIAYHAIQKQSYPIQYKVVSEVQGKDYLLKQDALPEVIWQQPARKLPWLTYKSYNDGQLIEYPLPLTEARLNFLPAFKHFNDLNARCHDTGHAIGCNFIEASIHGINEWIERDAYALFLMRNILQSSADLIKCVEKKSLPLYLKKLVSAIEETYQDDLIIVDITSDLKVPSFLVSFSKQKYMMQPKGLGTSLSKAYALERAIFEALQCKCLRNSNTTVLEQQLSRKFEHAPLLLRAAKCDLVPLLRQGRYQTIVYDALIDYAYLTALAPQLDCLCDLLKCCGLKAFYHQYYANDNGVTSLGVLIPGLEEFFLVKSGVFIMPKKRAKSILALTI